MGSKIATIVANEVLNVLSKLTELFPERKLNEGKRNYNATFIITMTKNIFSYLNTVNLINYSGDRVMDVFVLDVNAADRYELLKLLAEKLYETGYVKSTYLNALIERENEYPTGLVVTDNFHVAIPHADVEHVEKEALVVVRTNRRITFRKMDDPSTEVPVDVVFLLVIKEPKGYVKFLAALTNLFTNEEFVKIILNGSPQDVENYLRKNILVLRQQ